MHQPTILEETDMKHKKVKILAGSLFAFSLALSVGAFGSYKVPEVLLADEEDPGVAFIGAWAYDSEHHVLEYKVSDKLTKADIIGVLFTEAPIEGQSIINIGYTISLGEVVIVDEVETVQWSILKTEGVTLLNASIVTAPTAENDGSVSGYFAEIDKNVELVIGAGIIISTGDEPGSIPGEDEEDISSEEEDPAPKGDEESSESGEADEESSPATIDGDETPESSDAPSSGSGSSGIVITGKPTLREILSVLKNTLRDAWNDLVAHFKKWLKL